VALLLATHVATHDLYCCALSVLVMLHDAFSIPAACMSDRTALMYGTAVLPYCFIATLSVSLLVTYVVYLSDSVRCTHSACLPTCIL